MASADLTLASAIQINFGITMRFHSLTFDQTNHSVVAVWQSYDGTNLSGKFFQVRITDAGTLYLYTNGTEAFDPTITFSTPAVQNVIAQATLAAFGQAHVA